jgi:N-acetylglutamate synthase-like GNAT family acetyltransferase
LGVIEPERNKGAGTFLCKALLKKAQQKLYLVCIIPHFFMKLGFRETNDYPIAVSEKLNYCIGCLPVSETYVAMQYTF